MFKKVTRKYEGYSCFCDLCGRESVLQELTPHMIVLGLHEGWVEKKWVVPKQVRYEMYQFCPDCAMKIRGKTKRQILAMLKERGEQQ